VDGKEVEMGTGTVRCAVVGLEIGSVSCDNTVDNPNAGARVGRTEDGRLGAGRKAGSVGDSGCAES
jgi:hypothetical protein